MIFIRRFITNIYVYVKMLCMLLRKKEENKRILLIIDGLIGDIVLVQDFLKECNRYLHEEKGYSVDLFFSKSFVKEFYLECCEIYDLNVLDICFEKKNAELLDMMRVLHYFKNKKYEYVLNPLPKHKGDKLVGCINGKYKLAVRDDMIIKGRRISNLFRRLAYSDTIVVDKTEMEFCRFKRIISFLGDCEYKTGIPVIKKESCFKYAKFYCVFAVGASEAGKKYAKDRFVALASHIEKKTDLTIIFVGAKSDLEDTEYIIGKVHAEGRTINLTGKTNYQEWVNIIASARFVIGNDSASVHIAAATGVKAICIVGKWQYKRFYPYILDIADKNIPVPIFCETKLPCENCGKVIDLMPNSSCKMTLTNHKSYDCVAEIRVEQIIEQIDIFLSEITMPNN